MSEWFGVLPEHWELQRAKNLFQKENRPFNDNDEVVTCFRDGQVTLRKNRRLAGFTESTQWSGYQGVRKGDLVIHVMDAFAGAIGVSDSDGKCTPVYSCCTAIVDGINNDFYAYLLREMARAGWIQALYRGIRERSSDFRYDVFATQYLPLPPRAEQDQIVRYLDWKVSRINRLINAKKKQIALLGEQKRTVINEAVTKGGEGWKTTALKRLLSTPMSDGPHETPLFFDEGVPFVSAEASHDGRIFIDECRGYISREQHEIYCKKVKPQRNDIYIVKSGSTTGKTVLVDFDDEFSIWSPLALVRCKPQYYYRYVFYYLNSAKFLKSVQDNWSFGTQPNIGMGVLQNLPIDVPTFEEQNIIVAELDEKCGKIDSIIHKITTEISLLGEYKTRLISDVVTGKKDVRGIVVPEYETVEETAGDVRAGEEETEQEEE